MKYSFFLPLLLLSLAAFGQNLPSIGKASEISTGTFANGVPYYLVTCNTSSGKADFALMQKDQTDESFARGGLSTLPHFTGSSPYAFLASHGVGYTSEGFVSSNSDGSVYRFCDVPVSEAGVRDSTMLLLTDLMARYNGPQALVISGDIDVKTYKTLLDVFSLTVTSRPSSTVAEPEQSSQPYGVKFDFANNRTSDAGTVTVRYTGGRTLPEQMNTPVPLVSAFFAEELGQILSVRVRHALSEAGIPVGGVNFTHRGGDSFYGGELYELGLAVPADNISDAASVLRAVLYSAGSKGVTANEFAYAKSVTLAGLARKSGLEAETNRSYVDRCLASYLYGANLASSAAIYDFFARRDVSEDRELLLFNRFVSALTLRADGVSVSYTLPDGRQMTRADMADPFVDGNATLPDSWPAASEKDLSSRLDALCGSPEKLKIEAESAEPVTGGKIWTLSNGIKVVFKKAASAGQMSYSMMLRGGYASISGLNPGEGAFVADMLRISDIAGLSGDNFRRSLLACGITMDETVSLSDLRISGTAPASRIDLLLKTFCAIASDREPNMESFEAWRGGEAVREQFEQASDAGLRALADSLVSPTYSYSATRRISCLGDDLPQRAEAWFADRFANFADGMLVIVGDIDEEKLKTALCNTAGCLPAGRRHAIRPLVSYSARSGLSTLTIPAAGTRIGDGTPSCFVQMDASSLITLETYMSLRLAGIILERQLAGTLSPLGLYADVGCGVMMFPQERISLRITCRRSSPSGLPADVTPADIHTALAAVRSRISYGSIPQISQAEFDACRAALLDAMKSELSSTDAMADAVITRYSAGKNLAGGYEKAVKNLKLADVQKVFGLLTSGSCIEFIIE